MGGNHPAKKWGLLMITLGVILLAPGFPSVGLAAESGEFSGRWISNGTRTMFPFGADRNIYTFQLSGHVNLETSLGKKKDYWSECVGLADTATGTVARCIWKDLDGPEIYITLQTERMQENNPVSGKIVGGSGHLAGITGDLSFIWSSVSFQREDRVSTLTGQTRDLQGSYSIP